MELPEQEKQEQKPIPNVEAGEGTAQTLSPEITTDGDNKQTTEKAVSEEAQTPDEPTTTDSKKGLQLWLILAALSFTSLLTSLEATITSTALPSIIADLGGGEVFIWTANGYFLAM